MFEGTEFLTTSRRCARARREGVDMTDAGLDEPFPDVVEQSQDAVPGADEPDETELPTDLPLEADAADAAEQAREVETGEDEYR
jgi:hypothetical protein